MDFGIYAGDTNKTIYVRLRDSTTGLAKPGLVFNSTGAVCSYVLPAAARAAITLATQTVTGAHTDGGFVEVDATNCKGLYRLDLSDAAIASGDYTLISIEFDGIIEETILIPLHTRKVNTIEVGGTTQTARDIGASVLLSSGTGTGQLSLSSGLVTLAAATHTGAVIPTVTTLTGHTAQTGDTYALANGATGFTAIDTVVDAVKVKTDFLPSATAGASGGLFIAGTNAATTVTTSFTTTFTGNLTGSVASVSGAVGSVTGAVGSVTGAVGSVAGNVDGSVASVVGHTAQTGDSFARIGAAGAGLTDLGGMSTGMKAEVESEANDALVVLQLDHLLHVADASTTTDNSIIAKMVSKSATASWASFVNTTDSLEAIRDAGGGDATAANQTTIINAIGTMSDLGGGADIANNLADMAGATFSTATDSLEAIRDRGDSAWTTGAGGSDRLLMVDTTIATLASQVSFTLTAGSTDDDAYNGCTIVIEDVSTSTQKAIGIVDDYTGSTKTVTLLEDPAVFTMATTDKVYILAEKGLKPTTAADYHVDVSSGGTVGIDFANVDNPTATVGLTNTTVGVVTTNTDMRGTDSAATAASLATAQLDLDTITGADGVNLLSATQTSIDNVEAAVITNAAGVDIAADIIAVKAETALIVADTNELQTDWADGGRLDLIVDAILVDTGTTLDAAIAVIDANVDQLETAIITNAAGVDIAADIAAVKVDTAATLVDTAEIGTAGAGLTDLGGMSTGMKAEVNAEADTAITDAALATAAALATVDSNVDAILVDTAEIGAAGAGLTAVWTTAITESYGTDGSALTGAQLLYLVNANLGEFALSGTTKTAKKLDGSTTAATYTLDDGTNPTSITRTT